MKLQVAALLLMTGTLGCVSEGLDEEKGVELEEHLGTLPTGKDPLAIPTDDPLVKPLPPPKAALPTFDPEWRSCWMAFIHGSGSVFSAENAADSAHEWRPGSRDDLALPTRATLGGRACKFRYIGYQGKESFIFDTASVADQLARFIAEEGIPDKRLIIVTHSMGGLVARHLLNTIEPGSMRHRLYGAHHAKFAAIKRATTYAITLQAPHWGSEAADAVHGEATFTTANAVGQVLQLLSWQTATAARNSMRRKYMDSAAGWLSDEGRTIPIYTVAGFLTNGGDSRQSNGIASVEDDDTNLARLSNVTFQEFAPAFANDGMVEARSAHGQSISKSRRLYIGAHRYDDNRVMKGALVQWLTTPLNHNHGRYADINTVFLDVAVRDGFSRMDLGSKIRQHGLALPCSDPKLASVNRYYCR